MSVPRRRKIYRSFSQRRFASRTADDTCCGRRTVGTWTAAICVPAYTRKDIDLWQQTQGVGSAVTKSATRERARPLRNSARTARGTRRGTAENIISPAKSPGTEEKNEIASNTRATETCDENNAGLDSSAAIAFGNQLCEKKPINRCEAQSRDLTARLVIKLLLAKAKRENMPADKPKNRDIDRPRRSMAFAWPV